MDPISNLLNQGLVHPGFPLSFPLLSVRPNSSDKQFSLLVDKIVLLALAILALAILALAASAVVAVAHFDGAAQFVEQAAHAPAIRTAPPPSVMCGTVRERQHTPHLSQSKRI